ncbi:MAG: 2-C-methyl-D-erythritol 4-phosphate cytidylyltransferase [Mariprofundus sp.]|nr:2-C-methyl-D-erythritol 4-phosphate cytidylyltransferase [Mariprofundus sp.]
MAIDPTHETDTISPMKTAVLLLAAGSGSRFGGDIPKQYVRVAGRAIILHTLAHLAAEARITVVQPVLAAGDCHFAELVADQHYPFEILPAVIGGAERSISMQRGLDALSSDVDMVAVHDAARPLPSQALLADVLDVAERFGAAVPGVPVVDTIKRVDADGRVLETLQRQVLRAVQTPQVARREWFEQAMLKEAGRLHEHTDDASLLEAAGFDVHISAGDSRNRKITTMDDLAWLESELQVGEIR